MLLLLVRHADAGVPDEARWPDDADRPLTDLGRITQRKMGELLRRSRLSPGAIFSSPLRRARQTAEILAEVCETPAPLRICDALAGPPDLESIAAAVSGQPDAAIVALTGHSPWLDQLASLLLAGTPNALRMEFAKSAVMAIRTDTVTFGGGELVAFLQPGIADA